MFTAAARSTQDSRESRLAARGGGSDKPMRVPAHSRASSSHPFIHFPSGEVVGPLRWKPVPGREPPMKGGRRMMTWGGRSEGAAPRVSREGGRAHGVQ